MKHLQEISRGPLFLENRESLSGGIHQLMYQKSEFPLLERVPTFRELSCFRDSQSARAREERTISDPAFTFGEVGFGIFVF